MVIGFLLSLFGCSKKAGSTPCPESPVVEQALGDTPDQQADPLGMKLYRRENGVIAAYHEAWFYGSEIIEHWGPVGERGETRQHPRDESLSNEEALKEVLADALRDGYEQIGVEEHAVLLIEFSIDGMGTDDDLSKRYALQDRMNETLGWTGVGSCDGGSTGSGTMEVCCFVVDVETAKRVVAEDLQGTRFADYTRIYEENPD